MRSKLVWMFLMGGAVLFAAPASAQTYDPKYPVCLKVIEWGGGLYIDCSFTSLAQCDGSTGGRAAQCIANPFFGYGKGQPSISRRRQPRY